ncbi:hypothetical protein MKEN_00630000 [Mycena kentingensis (nom. inval.)]|nr:hypothetical protein MKEN_00630000 [Mycena kentingensis (nom. inval.)]
MAQQLKPSRRGAKREVPMEVLCFGFSRTGTMSLTAGLETLGYVETSHAYKIRGNPQDWTLWNEALDAKFCGKGEGVWPGRLGCAAGAAVCNAPHHLFAEDRVAAYPDAKIILTIRDADSWWKSLDNTLMYALRIGGRAPGFGLLTFLHPHAKTRPFWDRIFTLMLGRPVQQVTEEAAKDDYSRHNTRIRELIPQHLRAGKFLEYRVGDGRETLCQFLGKEVPKDEFPHLNDANMFREAFLRKTWSQEYGAYVVGAIAVGVMAALVKLSASNLM